MEKYSDGSPPPVVTSVAAPFILATNNLSDPEVLLAKAKAIVAPAARYFDSHFLNPDKQGGELERMQVARVFDPLYAKANPVTAGDVDKLKLFKFSSHNLIAPA